MTSFYSQSQIVTLSRLDRVLWDSSSPVSLFIDEVAVRAFAGDYFVPHLRNHETQSVAVIISPEGEEGILFALAEGIAAFCQDLKPEELVELPPVKWPEIWQNHLPEKPTPHRLLIIENFEQILGATPTEQKACCALLAHFAAEPDTSVLTLFDREFSDRFSKLPGFETLDPQGFKIQRSPEAVLPGLPKRKVTADSGKLLWPFVPVATAVVAALLLLLVFNSDFTKSSKQAQIRSTSAHVEKIEIATFANTKRVDRNLPYSITPFLYTGTVKRKPVPFHSSPTGVTVDKSVFQPSVPEIEISLTHADFSTPAHPDLRHSRKPLSMKTFLQRFEQSGGATMADVEKIYRMMRVESPLADSTKLTGWWQRIAREPENLDLLLSRAYAEQKDLRETFRWYEIYAIRTVQPDALCDVGAACLFGRGTPSDYVAAMQHLARARNAGSGDAAYLYGIAQLLGKGVKQNRRAAYYTFEAAMKQGSRLAYREAARMLELGYGVPQNLYWAFHLYEEGAKSGDRYCMQRVAEIIGTGENRLFPIDEERAEHWQQMLASAEMDPVHSCVRSFMPEDYYSREVVRR